MRDVRGNTKYFPALSICDNVTIQEAEKQSSFFEYFFHKFWKFFSNIVPLKYDNCLTIKLFPGVIGKVISF